MSVPTVEETRCIKLVCEKMFINSDIGILLLDEAMNYHFVLKLWLVINDEAAGYLCWNADKTAVIVDLGSLQHSYVSKLFKTQSVDEFLMLLEYSGFKRCPPEADDPSDSNYVVYHHSEFIMSNAQQFRGWLIVSHYWKQRGNGLPHSAIYDNVQIGNAKATVDQHLLVSQIHHEFGKHKQHGANSMHIQGLYCDRAVIQTPEYKMYLADNYSKRDTIDVEYFFTGINKPNVSDAGSTTLDEVASFNGNLSFTADYTHMPKVTDLDKLNDNSTFQEVQLSKGFERTMLSADPRHLHREEMKYLQDTTSIESCKINTKMYNSMDQLPIDSKPGTFYVEPNSQLNLNLAGLTDALSSLSEVFGSMEKKHSIFDGSTFSMDIKPQQEERNAITPTVDIIKPEPIALSSSFDMDEETPRIITNSLLKCVQPLDFD